MPATPLILIPGLMCDGAVWQPMLPALANHSVCQIVDHGEANNITRMAQQVLDAAPPRFALAGHSMGGRVALEVVRQAAHRVAALALLDTGYKARPAGVAGDDEATKRYGLLSIARKQGVRAMARQWVQGMVEPARLGDAALIEAIVSMFERQSADIFERQIAALLARPDATPVLAGVNVPTLVLCGRSDTWSPLSQHEEMVALMPRHAELQVVEQAGHMSTMEQPDAVAQALIAWLRRAEMQASA